MFLTMFGEKLNGTDPEEVIKNAFACFDEDNKGLSLFHFYISSCFVLMGVLRYLLCYVFLSHVILNIHQSL